MAIDLRQCSVFLMSGFARYSILTGFLILLFGSLTAFFYVNKLAYFGLVERLNSGVLQVWTFFLSLNLPEPIRRS